LLGGLFNLVIFGYGLKTQGTAIAVVAAVGVVACIVFSLAIRVKARNEAFFTSGGGRTDVPETADASALPAAES
jgi:hypothetical protein